MYSQKVAIDLLTSHSPADEHEQKAKKQIVDFVSQESKYWSRATQSGHLTASAWITNETHTQAVLLHHKKLDIWVQPGGHVDDEDESLELASLREAQEETGLTDLIFAQSSVFDLDVHKIPARKSEPEHWHLDVRFWLVSKDMKLVISEESNELKWLTKSEIEQKTDEESILRMVRKTLK